MYMDMHVYMYTYMYIYIYVYIYKSICRAFGVSESGAFRIVSFSPYDYGGVKGPRI